MAAIIPINRAPVHLEDGGHLSFENIALTLLVTKMALDTIQTDNFAYGAFTGIKYGVFVIAREVLINWAMKNFDNQADKEIARRTIIKASSLALGLLILKRGIMLPEPFRLGMTLILIEKGLCLGDALPPKFKPEYGMGFGLGMMAGAVI